MLKNVKSSYILEYSFYHLDENQKLSLVIYNKLLQKKININLNNYKFLSKKYVIFEKNGKGKEYNGYNDILEFEGEYINNIEERYLLFEGEYLDDKKWNGKGREYDYDGKLIFEGEYLNGEKRKRI